MKTTTYTAGSPLTPPTGHARFATESEARAFASAQSTPFAKPEWSNAPMEHPTCEVYGDGGQMIARYVDGRPV
jgi:hypothetical protein